MPLRPENYITFTCEANGCSNLSLEHISTYNKKKAHFCSKPCYGASRTKITPKNKEAKRTDFVKKFNKWMKEEYEV